MIDNEELGIELSVRKFSPNDPYAETKLLSLLADEDAGNCAIKNFRVGSIRGEEKSQW